MAQLIACPPITGPNQTFPYYGPYEELYTWVMTHVAGKCYIGGSAVYFERSDDALLYQLDGRFLNDSYRYRP